MGLEFAFTIQNVPIKIIFTVCKEIGYYEFTIQNVPIKISLLK